VRLAGLLGLLVGCASPGPGTPAPDTGDDTDTSPGDDSGIVTDDTADDSAADTGPDSGDDTGSPFPDGLLSLCINEFMPDNEASLSLEDGTWPDWVELHNPGKAEVSLEGWSITDDRTDPKADGFTDAVVIPPGGFFLLYADNRGGDQHLLFRLDADGGEIALFDPEGDGQIITYGNVEADFSVARSTDCCTGQGCLGFDFHGTPGVTNVHIVWVEDVLVPGGSTWRYWDRSEAPGEGWTEAGFDDSRWASGPGPLGFGDSHQATTIDAGMEGKRRPTTWFRTTFDLEGLDVVRSAFVEVMIDDGALVWLNGAEALRVGMAEGEVTADTWATAAVSGAAESTFTRYAIDATLLLEGVNTLAVEVHQNAPSSSDLTFDLSLGVERPD
jgi:hypothetical protein